EGCLHGKRSAFQAGRNRLALNQFHHQIVRSNIVEGTDVGMIQRGNGASFTLEALNELLLRDLNRDGAAQARIYRPKDLAHTACAELAFDTVWPQAHPHGEFGDRWIVEQLRDVLDGRTLQEFSASTLCEKRLYFAA